MQVVLKSRLGIRREKGATVYALPGETVDVDEATAKRLIANGLARVPTTPVVKKPVEEPAPVIEDVDVPKPRKRGRPRASTFDDVPG